MHHLLFIFIAGDEGGQSRGNMNKPLPLVIGPEHFTNYATPDSLERQPVLPVPSPAKSNIKRTKDCSKQLALDPTLVHYTELQSVSKKWRGRI